VREAPVVHGARGVRAAASAGRRATSVEVETKGPAEPAGVESAADPVVPPGAAGGCEATVRAFPMAAKVARDGGASSGPLKRARGAQTPPVERMVRRVTAGRALRVALLVPADPGGMRVRRVTAGRALTVALPGSAAPGGTLVRRVTAGLALMPALPGLARLAVTVAPRVTAGRSLMRALPGPARLAVTVVPRVIAGPVVRAGLVVRAGRRIGDSPWGKAVVDPDRSLALVALAPSGEARVAVPQATTSRCVCWDHAAKVPPSPRCRTT
jgi:hypothetical protein